MARYVTIVEVDGARIERPLATYAPVDGRLTNRNALLHAQEWAKATALNRGIKSYVLVLFRASRLSGEWDYVSCLPVSATATISQLQAALN